MEGRIAEVPLEQRAAKEGDPNFGKEKLRPGEESDDARFENAWSQWTKPKGQKAGASPTEEKVS